MAHPLREVFRPDFEIGDPVVRIVDLFSGCGGLTLGVAQAAYELGWATDVALAVESDLEILGVYEANFPKAKTSGLPIEKLLTTIGRPLTRAEEMLVDEVGEVDIIVGGPPCQGNSDLNNHTRRDDPKNELYLRMVRAAEVFEPSVLLIENVPAVRSAKANVVDRARRRLNDLGYTVDDRVICMDQLGVPQKRKRHVLLATLDMDSPGILDNAENPAASNMHDVRWAIGDLAKIKRPKGFDVPSVTSAENLKRLNWLLKHNEYDLPNRLRPICHQSDHSYKAMYGRLHWDEPAPTITSGFGSIGQGRFGHPSLPRALTPHEAARLQGFADYFDFSSVNKRGKLATMIGNAVPPALACAIMRSVLPRL